MEFYTQDEDKIIKARTWRNRFRSILLPRYPYPIYLVVCPRNDGKFYIRNSRDGGYLDRLYPDGNDRWVTHKCHAPHRTHACARAIAEMKTAEHRPLLNAITPT